MKEKLAKYLADYLAHGIDKTHDAGMPIDFTSEELKSIILEGLKTFENVEDAELRFYISPTNQRHGYYKD